MSRYSIDKTTALKVFKVDLSLNLCIDGICNDIPVLKAVHLPIPVCNINPVTYQLPGNGTLKGFLDHLNGDIGDSAIELVLQNFQISVRVIRF